MSSDSNSPSRSHRFRDAQLSAKARRNFVILSLTILSGLAYIGWVLIHANYAYWYIVALYFLAEFLALGSMLLWGTMLFRRREHSHRGLPLPDPVEPVDVLLTCCGEPFEIVEKTLRAAAAINYPDFKVCVADDRDDPMVKALCGELGFTHMARPTHESRKAGNLNHVFERLSAPFLLVLDADQVPHRNILQVMMGYFTISRVGFVTSYQAYNVPAGDPWDNRDRVFYGIMQKARNATNSAISCGSGVIYRRTALQEIGGFSTWNLVEDVYTSLELHAKGWKSVYHAFPVTVGTAPTEISSQVKQRWQWAVDSLRILFWRCPLFTKGLTWEQRFSYLGFGYHYLLFGIAYPIFFLLPAWGLFADSFFLATSPAEFIAWRLPYLVLFLIFNRVTTEKLHRIKNFRSQAGLFPVFFSAVLNALLSRNRVPKYSVTSKVAEQSTFTERLRHICPHLFIISINVAAIIYGFCAGQSLSAFYWVNTFWGLWACWILTPFAWHALRKTY
jgi:cellulose synthase (UDP-forming)